MANNTHSQLIKGGYINLGNGIAAMVQLNHSMCNDFGFLSLNEPYSYDNSIISIPLNYTIVAADTSPKAAIIFKSSHNAQLLFCN
ncbi:hypothetical protein CDAR_410591 [Caerostris darwini]|uniref:Uncharacterized protein n=1 Tax=Caerostris darwini TaxID=1538125 RepID=A0AAV4NBS0_9ARAC|nr:hypothetical protein CDAR_410591 [Caerostris darwini]